MTARSQDAGRAAQVWARVLRQLDNSPIVYTIATAVVAAGLWEIYSQQTSSLLIPTVGDIWAAVGPVLTSLEVWEAFLVSNQALVIGFALAVLLGVPTGLLLGRFHSASAVADGYVAILLVTPLAAITPLLLMALGIGLASRVVLVFLFAFIMLVITCRAGVRQIDQRLVEMARSYLASERQLWWHVLLPGAFPGIMAGLQLGLARAVSGMVIGELLLVAAGIGELILRFSSLYKPGHLYVVIAMVVMEALILSRSLTWLQRRLSWQEQAHPAGHRVVPHGAS